MVDAVRHHAELVVAAEVLEGSPAAREAVAALRQVDQERVGQLGGPPGSLAEMGEQEAEALAGQVRLHDLPPSILLPETIVDAPILGADRARIGERKAQEGRPQRRALGAVEVQKGVVEVEEDRARPPQGGYLAR